MEIQYAVGSVVGTVRRNNQDNFCLNGAIRPLEVENYYTSGVSNENVQLFAVCDGMGGEAAGEVASYIAVDTLKNYNAREFDVQWRDYFELAVSRIDAFQKKNRCNSGTTFACIVIEDLFGYAINIGDTRVYRIHSGKLQQLSKDHNQYQMLLDAGIHADQSSKLKSKAKSYLTQFFGGNIKAEELVPQITAIEPLDNDDYFLLCSDGLYNSIDEKQIINIITNSEMDLAQKTRVLIDTAEKQKSRDNITSLLIHLSYDDQELELFYEMTSSRIIEKLKKEIDEVKD